MGIFSGVAKIILSPIKIVSTALDDVAGENGENSQMLSLMTLGISSIAKGTTEAVREAKEDIFEN